MLGVMVLGVLEVIGGKGRVDRCPGASARAVPRGERSGCDDAAWIIRKEFAAVVSDWCSLGLCDTACLCTEFTIPRVRV